MDTVSATLDIGLYVDCPVCDNFINLLNEKDTNGDMLDDDGALLSQVFPNEGTYEDFECDEVTCTECKTTFNVKRLEY